MFKKKFPLVISVSGESLPQAWENAYLGLADKGLVYRRGSKTDLGDQIAAVMIIIINNPDADPFSHKKGGTNAVMAPLLDYYYEMLGAKPASIWEKQFNAKGEVIKEGCWNYTYFSRLGNYPVWYDEERKQLPPINQIDWVIKRLIEKPFSRRTNMITWHPLRDTESKATPCLQRLWFEIIPREETDGLGIHYEFRSRNVLNASFGNMQGLYMLGCHIRDNVEEIRGKRLLMRMVEYNDSYHVNSKDYPTYSNIVRRLKDSRDKGEPLEQRTFTRAEVINQLQGCRDQVESTILDQTEKYFNGDIEKDRKRVRAIGDRIFYLLEKYAPK